MTGKNYKRMMKVIDDVFATRHDPDQLQVSNDQIKKLQRLHRSTLTEVSNQDGPIIWCLIIPTTSALMDQFLKGAITETNLLELTQPDDHFDCIYLCSVTTLPEARKKGLTKLLCLQAIRDIQKEYQISALFAWPFSDEGSALLISISKATGLPLKIKTE